MKDVDDSHVPGKVPVWAALLALLLLIGGGGWLVWRGQFADTPHVVTVRETPDQAAAPAVQPAAPAAVVPAQPPSAGEDVVARRERLGIHFRHQTLTPIPEDLTYIVGIRVASNGMEIDASLHGNGSRLTISYSPLPPGGAIDSEKGQIRRGIELIGANPAGQAMLKIDKDQYLVLLSAAMPGRASRLLTVNNSDGSSDPLAAHMSDYFDKWNAANRAGKTQIEADWLAAVQKEGGERLAQLDAVAEANFDKAVAALSGEQRKMLIDLAHSKPSTQPVARKENIFFMDGPDGKKQMMVLPDGMRVSEQLQVCAGKMIAAYVVNDGKVIVSFQARVPTQVSADWISIDMGVGELVKNDKLASELHVTDEQRAQLRSLPLRHGGDATLPDADRIALTQLLADYCDCAAADRDAKGQALLKAVHDAGDRAYDPFMEAAKARDTAIDFILTSDQRSQLADLMHDAVTAK